MTDAVRVGIGACRCPGTPHDEDEVFLAPDAPLAVGLAAYQAISDAQDDPAALQTGIGRAFVRYGVVRWNILEQLADGTTQPARVTPDAVEARLTWAAGGAAVADAAAELYMGPVFDPLVQRSRTQRRSGPTDDSTSASPEPSSPLPNSSESSSPESSEPTTSSPATSDSSE